jgi:hypothetical protein
LHRSIAPLIALRTDSLVVLVREPIKLGCLLRGLFFERLCGRKKKVGD